jgi:hypothetical protein
MRDQISHPYETEDKIVFWCILIFKFIGPEYKILILMQFLRI